MYFDSLAATNKLSSTLTQFHPNACVGKGRVRKITNSFQKLEQLCFSNVEYFQAMNLIFFSNNFKTLEFYTDLSTKEQAKKMHKRFFELPSLKQKCKRTQIHAAYNRQAV